MLAPYMNYKGRSSLDLSRTSVFLLALLATGSAVVRRFPSPRTITSGTLWSHQHLWLSLAVYFSPSRSYHSPYWKMSTISLSYLSCPCPWVAFSTWAIGSIAGKLETPFSRSVKSLIEQVELILYLSLSFTLSFSREFASADTLVKMFFLGLIPGVIFASSLELLLTVPIGMLCFWDQIPEIVERMQGSDGVETVSSLSDLPLKHNLGFYIFLVLESYLVAALVEESVKSALATCSRSPYDVTQPSDMTFNNNKNPVATLAYFVAAGCGFAVMENLGYSSAVHGLGSQSLIAGVRSFISLPLHCLCAALTAVGLIGRDMNGSGTWKKILLPAVLVHGTFDLMGKNFALDFYSLRHVL